MEALARMRWISRRVSASDVERSRAEIDGAVLLCERRGKVVDDRTDPQVLGLTERIVVMLNGQGSV